MKNWHLHAYYLSLIAFVAVFKFAGPNSQKNYNSDEPLRSIASVEKGILGTNELIMVGDLEITAKVDTGADSSSLHAFDIQKVGEDSVRFKTQDDKGRIYTLTRKISKEDLVKSASGSHMRYYIKENVTIGIKTFEVEVNLADRSHLSKKFLIGKNILGNYFVDTSKEFITSN